MLLNEMLGDLADFDATDYLLNYLKYWRLLENILLRLFIIRLY
jgi:hypothetical protein